LAEEISQVKVHPLIRDAVRRMGLTPRESSLTELLAVGMPTEEASASLGISKATIRTHLRKIFASLRIASRVELVALVLASVAADADARNHQVLAS
jgi:DNA-binding CsgD family transcriptional regulator